MLLDLFCFLCSALICRPWFVLLALVLLDSSIVCHSSIDGFFLLTFLNINRNRGLKSKRQAFACILYFCYYFEGLDIVTTVVWYLNFPIKSVHIAAQVVKLNYYPRSGVLNTTLNDKFICFLWYVAGFFQVLRSPPPIAAVILLKYFRH